MKNLDQLRTFFRLSNATFDFVIKVKMACGVVDIGGEMQELHKAALIEVEKEVPDMGVLDSLLEKMQNLAEFKAVNYRKKFTEGGIKL